MSPFSFMNLADLGNDLNTKLYSEVPSHKREQVGGIEAVMPWR